MALTLYFHPLASYCHKVLIALYELGAPFEGRLVDLGDPASRAAFLALWPTGKMPLLVDDGRIVPETSIIIDYLDRNHPGPAPLLPADPDEALEARLWDRVYDQYVMEPMSACIADLLRPEADRDPIAVAKSLSTLAMAYDLIEQAMKGRTWAAGEAFGMADCAAAPALFYAAIVAPFPAGHSRLAAYFERLMARPSVVRTLEEARPWFHMYPLASQIPARFLG